mgnify:CR=1 FL=1
MAPQAELLPGTPRAADPESRYRSGPQHGYGVLLRIEQITGGALVIEQGALYPALARLEHNGLLDAEWALSDNNRRAKFYTLTAAGRKRLKAETERWNLAALALNRRCARRRSDMFWAEAAFLLSKRRPPLRDGAQPVRRAAVSSRAAGRGSCGTYRHDAGRGDAGRTHRVRIAGESGRNARQSRSAGSWTSSACDLRLRLAKLSARTRDSPPRPSPRLALGIGANTAVFSVFDAVIRDLPVSHPEQLVAFDFQRTRDSMVALLLRLLPSGHVHRVLGCRRSLDFANRRRRCRMCCLRAELAERRSPTATPEGVDSLFVSGDYFAGLGVGAMLGRTLSSADAGPEAQAVAVVSYQYWQRRLGGDPLVVGKTVSVNRIPVVIVGVTPAGFDGVQQSRPANLTLPLAAAQRMGEPGPGFGPRLWWLRSWAGWRPG